MECQRRKDVWLGSRGGLCLLSKTDFVEWVRIQKLEELRGRLAGYEKELEEYEHK